MRLSTCVAITALLCSASVRAQETVSSYRPLADAIAQFQQSRGKVITYEEPMLTWEEDLEEIPGKSGRNGYLYPKPQAFSIPPSAASEPDLAIALNQIVEAYNRHTSGARFRVLTSRFGYHIVPAEAHDSGGILAPASSLLDSRIYVPPAVRTPLEHLQALAVAVGAATGVALNASAFPASGSPRAFNQTFGPLNAHFSWGVQSMVARDALIDLLSLSATSLSWRLYCQAAALPNGRSCAINIP